MKFQKSFACVVGVDVSKEKLDLALPKESLTIKNNAKAIQQLVDRIKSDDVIVVMEATGGYENQLVQALHSDQVLWVDAGGFTRWRDTPAFISLPKNRPTSMPAPRPIRICSGKPILRDLF